MLVGGTPRKQVTPRESRGDEARDRIAHRLARDEAGYPQCRSESARRAPGDRESRRIDTLEATLGGPLFRRHARGYVPTDAGHEMLEVVGWADEMFTDLEGRTRERTSQFSGELVVTALSGIVPPVMLAFALFRAAHPDTAVAHKGTDELACLE